MIITSIDLTNFRNHTTYHLDCKPDTTLILGRNGSGKTSVLEAIYIGMQGKSFRATDQDILKRGKDFYRIEIKFDNGEKTVVSFDNKIKTFTVSDKKTRRLPKNHKYPIVLFQPSDLNLISGSPSRHRDYFDRFFSQLSDTYSTTLSRYNKALHQRNELLKSDSISESAIFSWNLLLARYGSKLHEYRTRYTSMINQTLNEIHHSIADNQDKVELIYKSEVDDDSESHYLNILENNYQKDLYIGHTSFGVHRDDYEFIFNSKKADGSASRGETRSIILALKFIEANIFYEQLNTKPIVLLDDVFSELDEFRRKCLVKNFKNHQVIITSVEKFK